MGPHLSALWRTVKSGRRVSFCHRIRAVLVGYLACCGVAACFMHTPLLHEAVLKKLCFGRGSERGSNIPGGPVCRRGNGSVCSGHADRVKQEAWPHRRAFAGAAVPYRLACSAERAGGVGPGQRLAMPMHVSSGQSRCNALCLQVCLAVRYVVFVRGLVLSKHLKLVRLHGMKYTCIEGAKVVPAS